MKWWYVFALIVGIGIGWVVVSMFRTKKDVSVVQNLPVSSLVGGPTQMENDKSGRRK